MSELWVGIRVLFSLPLLLPVWPTALVPWCGGDLTSHTQVLIKILTPYHPDSYLLLFPNFTFTLLIFLYVSTSSPLFIPPVSPILLLYSDPFILGSDPFVLYPVRSLLTLTFNTPNSCQFLWHSYSSPYYSDPFLLLLLYSDPFLLSPLYSDPFVQLLIVWSLPTLTFILRSVPSVTLNSPFHSYSHLQQIISCVLSPLTLLFFPLLLRPFPTLTFILRSLPTLAFILRSVPTVTLNSLIPSYSHL